MRHVFVFMFSALLAADAATQAMMLEKGLITRQQA